MTLYKGLTIHLLEFFKLVQIISTLTRHSKEDLLLAQQELLSVFCNQIQDCYSCFLIFLKTNKEKKTKLLSNRPFHSSCRSSPALLP